MRFPSTRERQHELQLASPTHLGPLASAWMTCVVLTGTWGCAHASPTSPSAPVAASNHEPRAGQGDDNLSPAEAREEVGSSSSRDLGVAATFQDLVALASRLDDVTQQTLETSCLLSGEGPYRLEADVAVAVRPLPSAPADLDERARVAPEAQALLRWGPVGQDGLAVVSFAHPRPPTGRAALLVITDEGLYALGLGHQLPAAAPAIPRKPFDEVTKAMAVFRDVESLWVTAEAGVPMVRLRAVLDGVPTHLFGHVGFAVALADGTKLPSPLPAHDDGAGLCPDGLPPMDDDAPLGDLDIVKIRETLSDLLVSGERCLAQARGPAALGGVVEQWLRVGPTGEVTDSCWSSDPLGDAALRSCLVSAAKTLRFAPPMPSGVVDLQLPVRLQPRWPAPASPVCGPR